MQFRVEHVPAGKPVSVPDGWKVEHTYAVDRKGGKPYFSILLSRGGAEAPKGELKSCIGFRVNED